MRVTIDIPDDLAGQLEPERGRVADILERGLRKTGSPNSPLRKEVISFLARRPPREEILQFRPSDSATERARNQSGQLTAAEEAELDEICEIDRFVSLIKAEVRAQSSAAA